MGEKENIRGIKGRVVQAFFFGGGEELFGAEVSFFCFLRYTLQRGLVDFCEKFGVA